MNRAFICGSFNFPRGGAASNYIQYFGLALKNCGYEVHIVSNQNKEYIESEYLGLVLDPAEYRTGKISHYYDYRTGAKLAIKKALKENKLDDKDVIFVYSHNYNLHKTIQQFAKKNNIKIGAIIVEYFPASEFSNGFEYKRYKRLMERVMPKYDFLLPISSYIEKKMSGCLKRQMVLPILADPFEYEFKEKNVSGTRKFIFPAKGKMKDALENMVMAIGEILKNPKTDVEFHFCGISKDNICKVLGEELDKRIIVHGWLEYENLVKLYQEMHFLLLARDINEMTKANFPSKVPELMCYGVVPIVSDVGDYTKYYLKNGQDSIFMDGCEPNTIRKAIEKAICLDNENLKLMSSLARNKAEKSFFYQNWVEKLRLFMESVHEDK